MDIPAHLLRDATTGQLWGMIQGGEDPADLPNTTAIMKSRIESLQRGMGFVPGVQVDEVLLTSYESWGDAVEGLMHQSGDQAEAA